MGDSDYHYRKYDDEYDDPVEALEAQLEEPVQLEQGYDKIVIVDNVPVVDAEKYDKLLGVLVKILGQIDKKLKKEDIYMPMNETTKKTDGFAFVTFSSVKCAQNARSKVDGYKLDRVHVFRVNPYSDLDALADVPETYEEPTISDYKEQENLRWWLSEPNGYMGQYVVRYGDETDIFWNEIYRKPSPIYNRTGWTDSYVQWSPKGSYVATFHAQGIILWGGQSWKELVRLQHRGVKLIDFSPNEKYIVTISPPYQENDNPKDPQCIIVWDLATGKKLRGFMADKGREVWPVFKWSHNDEYFARHSTNSKKESVIQVFQAPSMNLLDKKSLRIKHARDFCWSPSENILATWVPEVGDKPARVVLVEIPTRVEIRSQTLFNVTDVKIHWQNQGDLLCVKVDRHTKSKSKKGRFSSFEIFKMREKQIPIELFDIKENIIAFAWEPKGRRFAIIHSTGGNRHSVSLYEVDKKVELLKTLDNKPANHLFWSPRGSFIVLAGLGNLNGALEFFNVDELESMGEADHFMATDVAWDPTGRFFCTSVSAWRNQLENGYIIWDFQGKQLHKVMKDRFFQFLWRPRPETLLPKTKIKEIKKNLKQYSKRYQLDDKATETEESIAQQQRMREQREAFQQWISKWKKQYDEEREQRRKLRDGKSSDNEEDWEEYEEEVVDIIEETTEEL